MDSSYRNVSRVDIGPDMDYINMHELNVIDDGTKALYIVHESTKLRASDIRGNGSDEILDIGFREVNLVTGELLFEWWAYQSEQVAIEENIISDNYPIKLEGPPFNWFHGNSVDKNEEGDYLLSSRFTNTIFKISSRDSSIIWRLGGRFSSFTQDFDFSRQHGESPCISLWNSIVQLMNRGRMLIFHPAEQMLDGCCLLIQQK